MLRRLHPIQPEAFVFSNKNKAWAKEQVKKFPKGREASAIIPLLWRAQEQEGWLSRPAIEYVADFLGMNYIRALGSSYILFYVSSKASWIDCSCTGLWNYFMYDLWLGEFNGYLQGIDIGLSKTP